MGFALQKFKPIYKKGFFVALKQKIKTSKKNRVNGTLSLRQDYYNEAN